MEYNGRLYVYGTNDQQQSEEGTKNDYAHIKSLVVFSTDDMVNWIYHGRIEVGSLIYGTEECGIFAVKPDIEWINYRLALKINGEETPFTSITYNVTVSGLELDG